MTRSAVSSMDQIRETVALQVQATSVSASAREIRIRPAVLERFLAGETLYPGAQKRLQEWWVRESQGDRTTDGTEIAIGALVRDIPPSQRVTAIGHILVALQGIYRNNNTALPGWLEHMITVWDIAGANASDQGERSE